MKLWRRMTLLVAGALTALPGMGWTASPGKLDPYNVPGYLHRLERSRTPLARTIRRRIQDGPSDLARQREAARQEGIPVSVQELRIPTPPPALNAAPIYLRLGRVLKDRPLDREAENVIRMLGSRSAHTPQELDRVQRLLAERQDIMDLVHQATDRPQCVFQRDWSLGAKLLFMEQMEMRKAAMLLQAESYLMAREGRYQEATACQARGFRLAEHAAADAVVVTNLIANALAQKALSGMESILHLAGPDASVAKEVWQSIARHRPRIEMRRALDGEVVYMAATTDNLRRNGPVGLAGSGLTWDELGEDDEVRRRKGPVKTLTPDEQQTWERLIDAVEAESLQNMRQIAAYTGKSYLIRNAVLKEIDSKSEADSFSSILFGEGSGLLYAGIDNKGVLRLAREEVLMAGAALLAYRARQGDFPERLEQALPEAPLDPFSGQPLRYRREESGFLVYSVGPEGNFDGNEPRSYRPSDHALFRYPPPPPVRPAWLDPPAPGL